MFERVHQLPKRLFLGGAQIVLFALAIAIEHEKPSGFRDVQIDYAETTPFASGTLRVGNSNLSQAAASGHHDPAMRIAHQRLLQLAISFVC